jgi:HEPN domain-containing protein
MAPRPSPEAVRRRVAAAWLADAGADLANARSLSAHRDEHTAPFAAAFHAQQAVEKALKALLIWHGIDYPPKHDLGLLVGLLPDGSATRDLTIAGLTVYAVEQRYVTGAADPMSLLERPTWDEADEALSMAENAVSVISADLDAAGRTDGG